MKFFKVIKAFAETWWRVLTRSSSEPMTVSAEEKKDRLAQCHTCPYYMSATDMCGQCWCVMSIKASLKEAECPDKRWD